MEARGSGVEAEGIEALWREKYISLTTFRRNAEGVSTPIWFAVEGDRLVAFTGAQTGKAKRIRANPRATVAACTFRGKVKGPVWNATARILPDTDRDAVMALIRRKYRVTKTLLDGAVGVIRLVARRPQTHSVYLEIRLNGPKEDERT